MYRSTNYLRKRIILAVRANKSHMIQLFSRHQKGRVQPERASLNNMYSEQFDDAVAVSFFTDAVRTLVDPDAVTKIKKAIIDSIDSYSQANRTVIAPIINSLLLFAMVGKTQLQYPLQSTSTLTTALIATLAMNQNYLIV